MNAHSIPPPASPTAGRRAILLVLALFLLPVAIGAGLYGFGWRPAKTGNYGSLVEPPRPMPDDLVTAETRGHWLMLVADDQGCGATCRQRLWETRQVHVALNKEMERIRRVLISATPLPAATLDELRRTYPDLVVAVPANDAWRQTLGTGRGVFLVDPLGNLMMRYPDSLDPRGVYKDMERLLKYSWVG